MHPALAAFPTAMLMTELCARLQAERPQPARRHRHECPPEQLELVAIIACFRPVKLDHRPTTADLPKLGWRISAPGRWVDPIDGIDRAEGLALIIERDRYGFGFETFEPMDISMDGPNYDASVKRGPGRPRKDEWELVRPRRVGQSAAEISV